MVLHVLQALCLCDKLPYIVSGGIVLSKVEPSLIIDREVRVVAVVVTGNHVGVGHTILVCGLEIVCRDLCTCVKIESIDIHAVVVTELRIQLHSTLIAVVARYDLENHTTCTHLATCSPIACAIVVVVVLKPTSCIDVVEEEFSARSLIQFGACERRNSLCRHRHADESQT